MNQSNERNQSTTYTWLSQVFYLVLKEYENHTQEYSHHLKSIHTTQATNGKDHHRGGYHWDDKKEK